MSVKETVNNRLLGGTQEPLVGMEPAGACVSEAGQEALKGKAR